MAGQLPPPLLFLSSPPLLALPFLPSPPLLAPPPPWLRPLLQAPLRPPPRAGRPRPPSWPAGRRRHPSLPPLPLLRPLGLFCSGRRRPLLRSGTGRGRRLVLCSGRRPLLPHGDPGAGRGRIRRAARRPCSRRGECCYCLPCRRRPTARRLDARLLAPPAYWPPCHPAGGALGRKVRRGPAWWPRRGAVQSCAAEPTRCATAGSASRPRLGVRRRRPYCRAAGSV